MIETGVCERKCDNAQFKREVILYDLRRCCENNTCTMYKNYGCFMDSYGKQFVIHMT